MPDLGCHGKEACCWSLEMQEGSRIRRGDITPLPRLVRRVEALVGEVHDGAMGVEVFERRLGSTVGGVVWA